MGIFSYKKKTPSAFSPATPPEPPLKAQTLEDVPTILEALTTGSDKSKKLACKALYELSDVGRKRNRVPMLKEHFGVVAALLGIIKASPGDCRHLALLSLNNLSIPLENKKLLSEDIDATPLLPVLMDVIKTDATESYLSCICLMNLSFLESSVSLLASFPQFLATISAFLQSAKLGSEGVRWACGLLKNLSRHSTAARLILDTQIPAQLLDNLKTTSNNSGRWSNNSVEDFALFAVLSLAQHASVGDVDTGQLKDAIAVVKPVAATAIGIQSLKAKLILGLLPTTVPSDFPASSGADIIELLANILQKKGKDKSYSPGVFKLSTAIAALKGVAHRGDVSTCTTPQAASLLLQIVASYTLASRETKLDDVTPALNATIAFQAMLSLLLLKSGEATEQTAENVKAITEISSLFTAFKEFAPRASDAETVEEITDTLRNGLGVSRPAIVATAALWAAQRERDGVMSTFLSGQEGVEVDQMGELSFLPCAQPCGDATSGCCIA